MDGYIKLWRKIIENGWLKNHDLFIFWTYCLLKASYKCHTQIVGFKQVELQPGEFIFGRRKAAKDIKMSEQTIRTCLKNLESMGNLTIKPTHLFSIISINNWNTYQGEEIETNPLTNPRLTHDQPTPNHKQERKNSNKEKNKPYTVEFESFYNAYPKKKAPDAAWKAWQKRNGDRPPLRELMMAIENQKKSEDWLKDGGQYIPHPATWLNQGRWADEITKPKSPFGSAFDE